LLDLQKPKMLVYSKNGSITFYQLQLNYNYIQFNQLQLLLQAITGRPITITIMKISIKLRSNQNS